jgi:hypothetical protein
MYLPSSHIAPQSARKKRWENTLGLVKKVQGVHAAADAMPNDAAVAERAVVQRARCSGILMKSMGKKGGKEHERERRESALT